MERLEEKLDKIVEQIAEINVTMARNTASLDEHIRRTNMLEEKLEPVEKHVLMVNSITKFVITMITLAAAATAIYKVL